MVASAVGVSRSTPGVDFCCLVGKEGLWERVRDNVRRSDVTVLTVLAGLLRGLCAANTLCAPRIVHFVQAEFRGCPMAFPEKPDGLNSVTYLLQNENATLANPLRNMLMKDPRVTFAGYAVPHPSEQRVNIRVQTVPGEVTAEDATITALNNLQGVFKVGCNFPGPTFKRIR